MRALVVAGSRHGSTTEIADHIAGELRASGIVVDAKPVDDVHSLEPYDAVVLGSAIYMGRWMPSVRRFIDHFQAELAVRPVWVFTSGPLGDDTLGGESADDRAIREKIVVRGQRVFAGRLEPHQLGVGERLIAMAVHAPEGDFRDWEAIAAWAREIGATMHSLGRHQWPPLPGRPVARETVS